MVTYRTVLHRRLPFAVLALTLIVSLFATVLMNTPKALAAGSAVITVEADPTPVGTSQNVALRFYVTPSGASVNSVSVNVGLTNLSYVSYSAAGSAFNGLANVPGGGSATNFTVIGANQSFGGSSSKALILTVVAKASNSASTGQVTLSDAVARDTSENAMAATAQNASIPVTPGAGGYTAGNGQNVAMVPGAQAGPDVAGVEVTDSVLLDAQNQGQNPANQEDGPQSLIDKLKDNWVKIVIFGGLGLLVIIAIITLLVKRARRKREINHHMSKEAYSSLSSDKTGVSDNNPHDNQPPSDPTIINPQK